MFSKLVLAYTVLCSTMAFAESSKEAVTRLAKTFEELYNKGDISALAAQYAENAVLVPQDTDIVNGRTNIEAQWTEWSKQLSDLKLEPVNVKELSDDYVLETGLWSAQTRSQPPQTLNGKYTVVWQKSGSDWHIIQDMPSYKAPPPNPSTSTETK